MESQKAEITTLIDNAHNVLALTEKELNEKADKVGHETEKFITKCAEGTDDVKNMYKNFFKGGKVIDYFITIDLLIMPIIIGIIAYKVFIVWR